MTKSKFFILLTCCVIQTNLLIDVSNFEDLIKIEPLDDESNNLKRRQERNSESISIKNKREIDFLIPEPLAPSLLVRSVEKDKRHSKHGDVKPEEHAAKKNENEDMDDHEHNLGPDKSEQNDFAKPFPLSRDFDVDSDSDNGETLLTAPVEEVLVRQERGEKEKLHKKPHNREMHLNTSAQAKIWDHWGKWGSCSVTCGVGRLTRWRHCVGGGCSSGEKEAQIKTCTFPKC